MKQRKFETNIFYHLAEKYLRELIPETDITTRNIETEFWEEIEAEIEAGEIVILSINAKTRMGKSTLMAVLGRKIHEIMVKHKKTTGEFTIKNIMRDQQELSGIIKDPTINNTVIGIDEWSDLEATGENVTAEQALLRQFSNVQAARYIHRIWCSPKEIPDENSDVILEVVARERETYTTHVRVYYKLRKGGIEYTQPIGHINVNVGKLIRNWEENVKEIFYKYPRTREEEEYIQEQAKKDWWVQYNLQKHQKMDLITKEGISKPRILEYAGAIKSVTKELEPLTRVNNLITADIVRNFVKLKAREKKIMLSTLGEELMTSEVIGALKLWINYHKLTRQIQGLIEKREKGKMTLGESNEQRKLLEETRATIGIAIKALEREYDRYEEIQKNYEKK